MLTAFSRATLLVLALSLFAALPALAQDTTATDTAATAPPPMPADTAGTSAQTDAARQAAEAWLAYIDGGDLTQSYTAASDLLKEQMPEERWIEAVGNVKAQMGEALTRELAEARYTTTLENAPEGEYVVLRYNTDFASAPGVEVLVMRKGAEAWKAAGYVVRPAEEQ